MSQPRQPKVPPQAAPEQPPVEEPQQPQPVDPATLPAAQTAAEQPPVEEPPQDPATLPPADEEPAPLPQGHDDLVALAIDRGVPSYEAWNLTDADLRARLEQ